MVAPDPNRSCSSFAALPEALTAQILQHVPQQQRLQQCALTCKAWASAAALATAHVEQTLQAEGQAIPAFESWLQKHAGHLESLQLTPSCHELTLYGGDQLSYRDRYAQHDLQLPWAKLANLQRLQLERFMLTFPGEGDSSGTNHGASAGASGSSSSCGVDTHAPAALLLPSLQHLQLSKVQLVSSSSLLHLAGAPGLTSLQISDISFSQLQFCSGEADEIVNKISAVQQLAAAIPGLLQQLPRLAVLELPGMPMSAAALQQLGGMQGLQQVFFEHVKHMPTCDLQHLPSSITQLHIMDRAGFGFHGPIMPPQLQQLAGLLRLELHYCAVPPTVLGVFTRLQALKLFCCKLLPEPPELDDDDELYGYETEGTAALLDALAGMTCLQDLELCVEELDIVSTAPQRFAALTASTQLTRLAMSLLDRNPLAKGAAQHMLPAGKQLPLQELTITPEVSDRGWPLDEWCFDGPDIHNIATCCTRLQKLSIGHSMRPGADLSGLLELPQSLRALSVGGDAFGDAAAAVLGQLTQLDTLTLHFTEGLTDAGLEQLTNLDLGHLSVSGSSLSEATSRAEYGRKRINLKCDSGKGSVRQQLEELCDRSPVCAPARLKRLREANEQLQADNRQLCSDKEQLRSDMEQLCSDKEQLQAEVTALRMQLELSQAQVMQQQLKAAQSGDLLG